MTTLISSFAWNSLYRDALSESSSTQAALTAIHTANKAMVTQLQLLGPQEKSERNLILLALDDLSVLRQAWASRMAL